MSLDVVNSSRTGDRFSGVFAFRTQLRVRGRRSTAPGTDSGIVRLSDETGRPPPSASRQQTQRSGSGQQERNAGRSGNDRGGAVTNSLSRMRASAESTVKPARRLNTGPTVGKASVLPNSVKASEKTLGGPVMLNSSAPAVAVDQECLKPDGFDGDLEQGGWAPRTGDPKRAPPGLAVHQRGSVPRAFRR